MLPLIYSGRRTSLMQRKSHTKAAGTQSILHVGIPPTPLAPQTTSLLLPNRRSGDVLPALRHMSLTCGQGGVFLG